MDVFSFMVGVVRFPIKQAISECRMSDVEWGDVGYRMADVIDISRKKKTSATSTYNGNYY
jgi:hypothetical protein